MERIINERTQPVYCTMRPIFGNTHKSKTAGGDFGTRSIHEVRFGDDSNAIF